MSEAWRSFDVWLVDQNVVYRAVPFLTVADWIQEGRLLDEDRLRPNGATDWQRLADIPLLAVYLPQPSPLQLGDHAEALAPVSLDPGWERHTASEDEDVDMIPLIDISMVLLVFFMMTAGALLTSSRINTPPAEHARKGTGNLIVSMEQVGGRVNYFLGEDYAQPLTEQQLLAQLKLQGRELLGEARVIVRADARLSFDLVQQLTLALEALGIKHLHARVSGMPDAGE
jgi:biopolymer transport protein ExbD